MIYETKTCYYIEVLVILRFSGLTQVTINGESVLNATLQRVEELLDELPAQLEVGQPVLQEPLYIREAIWE